MGMEANKAKAAITFFLDSSLQDCIFLGPLWSFHVLSGPVPLWNPLSMSEVLRVTPSVVQSAYSNAASA